MRRLRQILFVAALGCFGAVTAPVFAQDLGVAVSPVLTVDTDRVFNESELGQRLTQELEIKLQDLVDENARLAAELETEEQALTEKRAEMEPAEFRELANAFDEKVQEIRATQDAKQREVQLLREDDRNSFINLITPILSAIGNERGALIIMERRDVLLSADTVDITEEAIARINVAAADPNPGEVGPDDPADSQSDQ